MPKKSLRKSAQSEKSRKALSQNAKTDYPVHSWPTQGSQKLAALKKKKISDLSAYELYLRSDFLPKLCAKYNATVRHAESEERRAELERTVRKAAKKVPFIRID